MDFQQLINHFLQLAQIAMSQLVENYLMVISRNEEQLIEAFIQLLLQTECGQYFSRVHFCTFIKLSALHILYLYLV